MNKNKKKVHEKRTKPKVSRLIYVIIIIIIITIIIIKHLYSAIESGDTEALVAAQVD